MFKRGDLITINNIPCVMVMIDRYDLRLIEMGLWNRFNEVNWHNKDINELRKYYNNYLEGYFQIKYNPIGDEE